jgi:mono/diheme cytochrome c family protein
LPTDARTRRRRRALAPVLQALRTGAWLLAVAGLAACRQDMHDQPKYSALEQSSFFPDGSSARAPLPGTVPRGELRDDSALYTGKENDESATTFPLPVDERLMARGQERFDVYCAPCHGRTGEGDGMIVQRGFSKPPSLLEPRLREAAPGHFFEVISNGFGAMPDHAAQIKPVDRWAIAAYIRALQLAGAATIDDVPQAERGRLEGR